MKRGGIDIELWDVANMQYGQIVSVKRNGIDIELWDVADMQYGQVVFVKGKGICRYENVDPYRQARSHSSMLRSNHAYMPFVAPSMC